jgi:hypothetical protein
MIFYGLLDLWLAFNWIEARPGELHYGGGWLRNRRHQCRADEIRDLRVVSGMQSGNRLYYDLQITTDKRRKLARRLRSQQTGQAIVDEIQQVLGS